MSPCASAVSEPATTSTTNAITTAKRFCNMFESSNVLRFAKKTQSPNPIHLLLPHSQIPRTLRKGERVPHPCGAGFPHIPGLSTQLELPDAGFQLLRRKSEQHV